MSSTPATLLRLAAQSAWNRRFVLALVVLSISLSTLLLLGIERVQRDLRDNFAQAVSGTDLIVGARGGPLQLLLSAVFHIGRSSNTIAYASAQAIARHRAVAWMVPIALGDSHRGFAVLGTSDDYFARFRYGDAQALSFAQGRAFSGLGAEREAVIGAEVARSLGTALGQKIVLSHGDGALHDNDHDDQPFSVVGILAPTATPVDRTVHVGLLALQAVHRDWLSGAHVRGSGGDGPDDAAPRRIDAALIGLKSRAAVFAVQRDVAAFAGEPLQAILPGVVLDELWQLVAAAERALQAISALVAVVSLVGLVAVILAGLNERRRELAILRALGAGPRHVLLLLAAEGALLTTAGVALGALACGLLIALAGPWVQSRWGIHLRTQAPSGAEWQWMAAVLAAGLLASLLPGWRAYRLSLADGLSPRT